MARIKSIRCQQFKRFTDLTITALPESARLVVLLGPNGCGKSSLFDAFNSWLGLIKGWTGEQGYWEKSADFSELTQPKIQPVIDFHEEIFARGDDARAHKAIYIRSAYRHEPTFQLNSLARVQNILADEKRPTLAIRPDMRVSDNYQRLVSMSVHALYSRDFDAQNVASVRERLIGKIRQSMLALFDDGLVLEGLGDPLHNGSFYFSKGSSKNYFYKNLSGGEKAAFDLILDLVVKTEAFDDTVFAIDEPELHMHPRLQANLLEEMYGLIPDKCQLWLATHSIGMIRKAIDLHRSKPEEVVFLDFGGLDFDQPQTIRPAPADRNLWQKAFSVALHDLAELIAPENIVICEGKPHGAGAGKQKNAAFDAQVYNSIFGDSHPDTSFVSAGNCNDVVRDSIKLAAALNTLVPGVDITTLIDRDNMSEAQVNACRRNGRVLSRYSIETFLWSDEILEKLVLKKACSLADQQRILALKMTLVGRPQNSPEDPLECVKDIDGQLFTECMKIPTLRGNGTTPNAFALSALAPLVTADTRTYQQLEADIFA